MKTNIDTINAFVEYEQVLEELLNFYNDSVAFNKISFDKGVKTPDSPFWFSVTRFLTYRNFKTIDFSDKNYKNIREKVGNGKMVKYIIERIGEERVPSIMEIEAMASDFMNQVIV